MIDLRCSVLQQTPLIAGYWSLELAGGKIAETARPGQFVHVRVPGLERASLRRPFSIFGAQDGVLKILYKTVGRGTEEMNGLRVGDAMVFARHANIIVNAGQASAADVLALAGVMKSRVRERFGVTLEEEVVFLGERPVSGGAS